ncbi:MAG TPA: hypothetical protein VFL93_15535 [Longimicrobiaceae bacterium]|nr:hypothetical protein [Longimicrobiaceae bacterium]
MSADDRVAAARGLLLARGFVGATVRAAGTDSEIAVLGVAEGDWERMLLGDDHDLARALKALGFRYVSLDMEPLPPG